MIVKIRVRVIREARVLRDETNKAARKNKNRAAREVTRILATNRVAREDKTRNNPVVMTRAARATNQEAREIRILATRVVRVVKAARVVKVKAGSVAREVLKNVLQVHPLVPAWEIKPGKKIQVEAVKVL